MIKVYRSEDYNYNFDTETGYFERWGKTLPDNPVKAPAPEILDIEISEQCKGIGQGPCKHCYKSNTPAGEWMRFEDFKEMFDKLPDFVTQVALGIGDIDSNPDLFKITDYLRSREIIPNITINGYGLTDEIAEKISKTFGAVSVSRYNPKDVCYDAVKKLTDCGLDQVNIHSLVSEETYEDCLETIKDCSNDERLSKLSAVVFLSLKQKGNRNKYNNLSFDKYSELIKQAMSQKINVGFDSCSTPLFLESTKNHKAFKKFQELSDSCESYLFSLYINVRGEVYPCSFIEGQSGHKPIVMKDVNNFIKEVWESDTAKEWRDKLIDTNKNCNHLGDDCRMCPEFNIYSNMLEVVK